MALIKCPECNHEMSDTAKSCPNCGYRPNKMGFLQANRKALGVLIAIVSVVAVILVALGVSKNLKAKKEEAKNEEDRKEKTYRATDENSAESLRHYVEIQTSDKDINEELVAIVGYDSSERNLIRIDKNGIEYCLNTPKLKEAIEREYGEQLNGGFFKSVKYKAKTLVITLKLNGEYSSATVCGKWE